MELYIKTTAPKKTSWSKYPKILWRRLRQAWRTKEQRDIEGLADSVRTMMSKSIANQLNYYGKYKNIIVDTRKLPLDDLRALYNSAHCFVLPTLGEGWGLTLCEAMATGCPCIATNVTGVTEFFNSDVGYEIKYEVKPVQKGEFRDYPELETTGYFPDTKHFLS